MSIMQSKEVSPEQLIESLNSVIMHEVPPGESRQSALATLSALAALIGHLQVKAEAVTSSIFSPADRDSLERLATAHFYLGALALNKNRVETAKFHGASVNLLSAILGLPYHEICKMAEAIQASFSRGKED